MLPIATVRRLALATVLLVAGATRLGLGAAPAGAAITHVSGFSATVDGFSSWYGSYGMGALGVAWCIDHGIRAPDPALGYVPTGVADRPAATRTALAWLFGRHGTNPDRVTSAALMLAAHDLMGAIYPSGRLDLGRLTTARMAGFGSAAAAVLERARSLKADALAHAGLQAPYRLTVAVEPVTGPPPPTPDPAPLAHPTAAPAPSAQPLEAGDAGVAAAAVEGPVPGTEAAVVARLTDAAGTPVSGIGLTADISGATPVGPTSGTTAADGTVRFRFVVPATPVRVEVAGTAPDLVLHAWAPTAARAQRVAQGRQVAVAAALEVTPRVLDGRIRIHKRGDAEPLLPVAGARFEVWPEGADEPLYAGDTALVVGGNGWSEPVIVPPGRYEVREVEPPPGYEVAGPWIVDVAPDAVVTLEVDDVAVRGSVSVLKVDADSFEPVAGAVLAVHHDADGDGTYETVVAEITTELAPVVVPDLLPGAYRVLESAPPPGYELDPTPVDVTLAGGEVVPLAVQNRRVPAPATTTTPTTVAPTTTTPTTPTSATPTTAAPTTTGYSAPPPTTSPPAARVPAPTLPRTGTDPVGLASTGAGLVLLGSSALGTAGGGRRRRRARRGPRRRNAGPAGAGNARRLFGRR